MATTTYGIGIKDIKAGPVGAGGIMGTVLTSIGKIYKDTVSLQEADGTITRHFSENSKQPFLAVFEADESPIKFTVVDVSATNLAKWLGGTAATSNWSSALESFSQELSVEIISLMGVTLQIARCFLYGKITWNMTRTEIAKIEITGEIMEPEDAGTPPVKRIDSV